MFTIPSTLRYFFAIVISFAITTSASASAIELKIGGTGNALGTMKLLGEAYMQDNPNTKITVLPSIGSSGAMRAVPENAIDIGLASRPPKDSEAKDALTVLEYARAPSVLAVSKTSSITTLSTDELINIYNGTLTHWPDGSLIRPIMRQPGDDNTQQLNALSAELAQAIEKAGTRSGLPFAYTDQEAVEKLESIPGSIGVTTLALLLSEKRFLHPLIINNIEPSVENLANGSYPDALVKHFYLVVPKHTSEKVQHFIDFIRSDKGAQILTDNGHLVIR